MKILASATKAFEFACHSKVCAPPPAGRGGSSKGGGSVRHRNRNNRLPEEVEQYNGGQWFPVVGGKRRGFGYASKTEAQTAARHANYVREMIANRKNTTVNRDGNIAVTSGGGAFPRFRVRNNKSSEWVADKMVTKSVAIRAREQAFRTV